MRPDDGGRADGGGTRVKGAVQAMQQGCRRAPPPSTPPALNRSLGNFSRELQGMDHFPLFMGWRCPRKLRDGFQVTTGIHLSPSQGGEKL